MAIVRNHRSYPLTLTGGRVLAPEETANVDVTAPNEAALLATGALIVVDPNVSPPAPVTPPGGWKATVETVDELPAVGNFDGDVRLVRDVDAPYVWDTTAGEWSPLSAQGAGVSTETLAIGLGDVVEDSETGWPARPTLDGQPIAWALRWRSLPGSANNPVDLMAPNLDLPDVYDSVLMMPAEEG